MQSLPESTQRLSPISSLILESGILMLVLILAFVGWLRYKEWYVRTVPVIPLPDDAYLVRRNPEFVGQLYPYHSAITRDWYYAKYATSLSYEEVQLFYRNKRKAIPFGGFSVEVLPPATTPVTKTYDQGLSEFLALPLTRTADDPPGKTLILVEVSKTAVDYGPRGFTICIVPFAFIIGIIVILTRYKRKKGRAS
jgi:hypothetical protein